MRLRLSSAAFLVALAFNAQADCSIWDIGDRLSTSVTPATREAFSLLDKAFTNPELMHSPAFRDRLARAMEAAGYDGKKYLAPPSERGPFPSKRVVSGWVDDMTSIVACD